MKYSKKKLLLGQSMLEFLIASSATTLVVVYGASILGEFGIARLQAVSGARLAAWQRTAWVPSHIMEKSDLEGVAGATAKNDTEITRDIIRHSFLDNSYKNPNLHAVENSEFNSTEMVSDKKIVKVATILLDKPDPLKIKSTFADAWDSVRAGMGGDVDSVTESTGKFALWGNSYVRNEVTVKNTSTTGSEFLDWILKLGTVNNGINIVEQVTILTEPWNAGGTHREQIKIQGLVPLKMMDLPAARNIRGGWDKAVANAQQIIPAINKEALSFGFAPGGAPDVAPLDRFEQEIGWSEVSLISPGIPVYGPKPGYFRPYRAFPPTPLLTGVN